MFPWLFIESRVTKRPFWLPFSQAFQSWDIVPQLENLQVKCGGSVMCETATFHQQKLGLFTNKNHEWSKHSWRYLELQTATLVALEPACFGKLMLPIFNLPRSSKQIISFRQEQQENGTCGLIPIPQKVLFFQKAHIMSHIASLLIGDYEFSQLVFRFMPVKVFDTTEEPPMILSLCVTWGDSRGTSSWTPKHQPIGVHILDGHQVVWVLSSSKCMKYMLCSYDIIWYTVMSETYISFLHDMFNGTRGCLYPPRLTISTRQHDSRKTVNVVVQSRTWEMHWNDGFQTLL